MIGRTTSPRLQSRRGRGIGDRKRKQIELALFGTRRFQRPTISDAEAVEFLIEPFTDGKGKALAFTGQGPPRS
jgi:hypothetical protein